METNAYCLCGNDSSKTYVTLIEGIKKFCACKVSSCIWVNWEVSGGCVNYVLGFKVKHWRIHGNHRDINTVGINLSLFIQFKFI